ncbi:MAG TPA: hypothetical protein VNF93_01905, partial [Buchnera sp. (in: enterobacteria)]|nr:hypothetical protein [Buchnera sp. (in: enterobacteria)]
ATKTVEKEFKFNVGDIIEAKLNTVDRKNRLIHLIVQLKEIKKEIEPEVNANHKKEDKNFSNTMIEAFKAAKNVD